MPVRKNTTPFLPILIIFTTINAVVFAVPGLLQRWQVAKDVLLLGNVFLFLLTFISYRWAQRGLTNPNPHAFVRAIYSGILLKLFVSLAVATVYIATVKSALNKPAFFSLMALYLVYTFLEVSVLTKALRNQPNA